MKFFVAGASGMFASDLIPLLKDRGEVFKGSHSDFNITDLDAVRASLSELKPDTVINCAAYTAVDRAESEEESACLLNASGPENLATVCREIGARLVHISTDFVFDGKSNRPYNEDDTPNPLGVYGKTKLDGERLITEMMDNYLIVRTSWLYGLHGNNFVKTITRLAKDREELSIVYDQTGTPTFTKDLAEGIVNLMEIGGSGIYHFSNEGVCSWYDFAYEIVEALKDRGESLKLKRLKAILTEEYPVPAERPNYSVLDKSKYKAATSKYIPHWRDGLKRYFNGEE